MTLTPVYSTKSWLVTHSNGTTESFQTRAAAVERYPQLGQQAALDKQTKTARRNERQQGGQRV